MKMNNNKIRVFEYGQKLLLLLGAFLLSASIQSAFAAGYMFVYSDTSTCPSGTVPTDTWVHYDQRVDYKTFVEGGGYENNRLCSDWFHLSSGYYICTVTVFA